MTKSVVVMGGGNIHGRILIDEMKKAGVPPEVVINETGTKRADELSNFLNNTYDNPPSLEQLMGDAILPVSKFDNAEVITAIQTINPSYVIFGGQGIVKNPLLSLRQSINVHPGLLPFFRGVDPVLWSVYNKKPVGATVQYMAEGIDEGDILNSKELPWSGASSLLELRLQCMRWGGVLLAQFLSCPSDFPPQKQDLSHGNYYKSFPEKLFNEAEDNLKYYR